MFGFKEPASLPPKGMRRIVEEHKRRFGDTPRRSIFEEFSEKYGEYGILSGPEPPMTPELEAELEQRIVEMEARIRSYPPCKDFVR